MLVAALLLPMSACGSVRTDTSVRTTIASNRLWTIVGVGNLTPPATPLTINRVMFEAWRYKRLFTSGELWILGSDEWPFTVDFPRVTWQGDNVVAFERPAKGGQEVTIRIINDDGMPVPYLRLHGVHMLLVLDLQPGESREVKTKYGEYVTLYVRGELSNRQRLELREEQYPRGTQGITLRVKGGLLVSSSTQ
jgi:hypothetical protein